MSRRERLDSLREKIQDVKMQLPDNSPFFRRILKAGVLLGISSALGIGADRAEASKSPDMHPLDDTNSLFLAHPYRESEEFVLPEADIALENAKQTERTTLIRLNENSNIRSAMNTSSTILNQELLPLTPDRLFVAEPTGEAWWKVIGYLDENGNFQPISSDAYIATMVATAQGDFTLPTPDEENPIGTGTPEGENTVGDEQDPTAEAAPEPDEADGEPTEPGPGGEPEQIDATEAAPFVPHEYAARLTYGANVRAEPDPYANVLWNVYPTPPGVQYGNLESSWDYAIGVLTSTPTTNVDGWYVIRSGPMRGYIHENAIDQYLEDLGPIEGAGTPGQVAPELDVERIKEWSQTINGKYIEMHFGPGSEYYLPLGDLTNTNSTTSLLQNLESERGFLESIGYPDPERAIPISGVLVPGSFRVEDGALLIDIAMVDGTIDPIRSVDPDGTKKYREIILNDVMTVVLGYESQPEIMFQGEGGYWSPEEAKQMLEQFSLRTDFLLEVSGLLTPGGVMTYNGGRDYTITPLPEGEYGIQQLYIGSASVGLEAGQIFNGIDPAKIDAERS